LTNLFSKLEKKLKKVPNNEKPKLG